MKVLLDTHVFLWASSLPTRLSPAAAAVLTDSSTDVRVSAATAWKISIKRAQGRLAFPPVTAALLRTQRMTPLPISLEHAAAVEELPLLHRDPFDRMLVAQARAEGLTLVTRDPEVRAYDVPTLWD